MLLALVLAFGFAACTPQGGNPHESLLMAWQWRWRRLWRRRPRNRQTLSDEDYLRQLSGNQED